MTDITMETTFQRGDHVGVDRYSGVAFWYLGPCRAVTYDECGDESFPAHHEGCVEVCMVGDDYTHHVDVTDLISLEPEAFCGNCGQIGCIHG